MTEKRSNSNAGGPRPSRWDEFDLFHDGYGYAWGILLLAEGETPDGTKRQRVERLRDCHACCPYFLWSLAYKNQDVYRGDEAILSTSRSPRN